MNSFPQNTPSSSFKEVTCLALILGDFWLIERPLSKMVSSIAEFELKPQILSIYDGPQWEYTSIAEQFRKLVPNSKAIFTEQITDLPAVLLNHGLKYVQTTFCTFIWPGSIVRFDFIPILVQRLKSDPNLAGVVSIFKPDYPSHYSEILFPFLQCVDGVSLQAALFRTDKLLEIGGADPNPIFQRVLDWDVLLRLSENFNIDYYPINSPGPNISWQEFPFIKTIPVSYDQIHRCIIKRARYHLSLDKQAFRLTLPGLPREEQKYFESLCTSRNYSFASLGRDDVIRVTVTGGIWEPHHNQLCFYNYFELPEGQKQFHWKPVFDYLVNRQDIEESDLVIISRGRCPHIRNILDWCESEKIPTLYMIDDNWFTVANDWNVYADLFSPGKPDYETFLEALRRCTATLVYNPVLEKYVFPYAKRVIRIHINILLDLFLPYWPKVKQDTHFFVAGYTGSLRYTNAAFEGLADFVLKHSNTKIFYFGDLNYLPPPLKGIVDENRYICIPYAKNYAQYAKTISKAQPDVLLAPLDNSITSQSKCFNKYLEITAAGATGIYSGISPYTEVIRDGHNGLLIPPEKNDQPSAWAEALEILLKDPILCRQMALNALTDVKTNFDTSSRYPDFLNMIHRVISFGEKDFG